MTPRGIFVTGTDTDVGKTVVSAGLCLALDGDYWKPVQAGHDPATDQDTVAVLTGAHIHPSAVVLSRPRSPHEGAVYENIRIEAGAFALPASDRPIVVEGAGGALVPLNERETVADLIRWLGLPCLVVARSGLGTINHTCLTVEALRRRGIDVRGAILNGPHDSDNRRSIEHFARVPVIAEMPKLAPLDRVAVSRWAKSNAAALREATDLV